MSAMNSTPLGQDVSESRTHFRWIFLAIAVLLVVLPFYVYQIFLMKVMCYALFAIAFNILLGHCGLLSLGHAAFFGAGCYMTAFAASQWGLSPELSILSGIALAILLGLVFGLLSIKRHGIYLTMVTLGLAQLVYFYVQRSPYTKAEDGIQNVPRGTLFGLIDLSDDRKLYICVAVVFFAALLACYRLVYSPFGQVIRAVRGNEARAISLGINVQNIKLLVFVISAALSGLAGSMKAIIFQIASMADVHLATSGEVVLMTLIGGVGTILGPIVGAIIVVVSQNYLAHLGEWVVFIQGLIFVVSVMAFREGIVGLFAKLTRRQL